VGKAGGVPRGDCSGKLSQNGGPHMAGPGDLVGETTSTGSPCSHSSVHAHITLEPLCPHTRYWSTIVRLLWEYSFMYLQTNIPLQILHKACALTHVAWASVASMALASRSGWVWGLCPSQVQGSVPWWASTSTPLQRKQHSYLFSREGCHCHLVLFSLNLSLNL
jgi:hypothetical protein